MTNRTILLLALTLAAPACLGDTPDTSTTGLDGLQPGKPIHTIPSTLHANLTDLLTSPVGAFEVPATIRKQHVAAWSETVADPESCADCTITLVHRLTEDGGSIEVLDASGELRCEITSRLLSTDKLAIVADSCGARE